MTAQIRCSKGKNVLAREREGCTGSAANGAARVIRRGKPVRSGRTNLGAAQRVGKPSQGPDNQARQFRLGLRVARVRKQGREFLPNDRVKDQTGPRINGFIRVRMTHSSRENRNAPILPRKHGGGRLLVKIGTGHDHIVAEGKSYYLVGSLRSGLSGVKPFCSAAPLVGHQEKCPRV